MCTLLLDNTLSKLIIVNTLQIMLMEIGSNDCLSLSNTYGTY